MEADCRWKIFEVSEFKKKWHDFIYFSDGGKERLNLKKILAISMSSLGLTFVATSFLFGKDETGHSIKTESKIIQDDEALATVLIESKPMAVFETAKVEPLPPARRESRSYPSSSSKPMQLKAQQVITRGDNETKKSAMPTGANFIGKLLSAVDTRDLSSMVKVLLPYGAKFQGKEFLERDAVLIGKATFSGKGERVFLSFDKVIDSNGREMPIVAHALDTADYANGVIGDTHSETSMRVAGTLGLTMISGMTDVLTEKTAHGDFGITTPKSTMRNAVFHGISKVSGMEASRQIEELAQAAPYVTLDAGMDVIITLSSAFSFQE